MIINIDIIPRPLEPIDKALKRFNKKCKKENITKDYCDRRRFQTNREKRRKKEFERQKLQRKINRENNN